MKKMLKAAAVLAAILMALTLGACSDGDDGGSGSGGGSGKPQSETFKKFDVPENGVYYVNKDGEISAEKKDGYVFKVRIYENEFGYSCSLEEYTGSESSVSIPEGVTYIEFKVFDGCEELTRVILPKGINSITGKAFNECAALTTVEFKGVIVDGDYGYIGYGAFYDCDKLVTVKYAGTKEQWKSIRSENDQYIGGSIFYSSPNEDYHGQRVTVECKDGKLKSGGYNGELFEDAD